MCTTTILIHTTLISHLNYYSKSLIHLPLSILTPLNPSFYFQLSNKSHLLFNSNSCHSCAQNLQWFPRWLAVKVKIQSPERPFIIWSLLPLTWTPITVLLADSIPVPLILQACSTSGLCTCCYICLEHSSPTHLRGCPPHFLPHLNITSSVRHSMTTIGHIATPTLQPFLLSSLSISLYIPSCTLKNIYLFVRCCLVPLILYKFRSADAYVFCSLLLITWSSVYLFFTFYHSFIVLLVMFIC